MTVSNFASPVSPQDMATGGNRLLAAMAGDDRAFLAGCAERVRLPRDHVMVSANQAAPAAYFIETGIASIVKPQGEGRTIEIALTGPEGFVGTALAMADGRWPYEVFVQVDCLVAVRVDAADLVALVDASPTARRLLLAAAHVQMVQVGEGLASAAWQRISARLSRWLLMYSDRLGSDTLDVTHEFMALMVGAQRTRITEALHELEGGGAILSTRGRVVIRDAGMLARLADGSYGIPEREARRLLDGRRPA